MGAAFLVAALLAASCSQEQLPTAPSALTYGIVIYEHSNFLGRSALLTTDVEDLSDYQGPCEHTSTSYGPYGPTTTSSYDWEDCISSIKLTAGWRATIYEDRSFHGASFELTADVSDLQLVAGPCHDRTFNDCVSSIRLRPR